MIKLHNLLINLKAEIYSNKRKLKIDVKIEMFENDQIENILNGYLEDKYF